MPIAVRADAARNRAAILSAASRLFDEATDPAGVPMDAIADAAGVGKGTLFRRFGDRSALLLAVYEERLGDLRAAIHASEPPSVDDPVERIAGILEAIVLFKLRNRRLVRAVEDAQHGAASLYTTAQYVEVHTLIADVLAEMKGALDVGWTAHALLATTRIDLVDHLVTNEGMATSQIVDELRGFAARLLRR